MTEYDEIRIELKIQDEQARQELEQVARDLKKFENQTKGVTDKNRRFADEGDRKVVPFIRRYRWALSLLLITQNAVYRLAQGTKILASMLNLLTKAIGFVIDMALKPFIPYIILAAMMIFKFGEWLGGLPDPINKVVVAGLALLALFAYFGTAAILSALTSIADAMIAIGVSEAVATGAAYLLGLALAGLAGLTIGIIITWIMDETGIMDRVYNLGSLIGDFFAGLGYEAGKRFVAPFVEAVSRAVEGLYNMMPDWAKPAFKSGLGGLMGLRQATTPDNLANPYWDRMKTDREAALKGSEAIGGERWKLGSALSGIISNPPTIGGSAPHSALTNTNTTNQPININTVNVSMPNAKDYEAFAKELQAGIYKSLGRNVSPVR